MRLQLHAIAAGVGLTYELLTGDLSQVNYSSIRAGLIEFRRRMEALQWQLLVPGLCQPVWRRFVLAAQAAGKLPDGEIGVDWTAPRFEAVDPMKDIQADILAVRAGVMTLKEAIARQGYEPAQVLAEIAAINTELDALGITLDTDPRRSTRTGLEKQQGRSRMPAKPPDQRSAAEDVAMPPLVDLPVQTRADVRLMPESVDAERRTVEVVWSTGAAVRRRDPWTGKRYDEVLSLEEAHVDLSRLNGGAPLLNTHGAWDLRDVIGVVERAWIAREGEALVGRATVRFSDRADVEPIWRDVASGIVRNVSVGYAVRSYEITETDGAAAGLARRRLAAARALRRADRRRRRRRLPCRRTAGDAADRARHPSLPSPAPRPGAHCRGVDHDPRSRDRDHAAGGRRRGRAGGDRARRAGAGGGGARRSRGAADPRRRADVGACGRGDGGPGDEPGAEPGGRRGRGRARPGRGAAPHRHDPGRRAQARRRRARSPTTSSPAASRSMPPAPR